MVGHVTKPTATPLNRLPSWVTLIKAANPGPMTLDGTNTWILTDAVTGASVAVDPGPDDDGHLAAVAAHRPVLIVITHGHPDHVEGLSSLRRLCPDATVWWPGAGVETSGVADRTGWEPFVLGGLRLDPLPTPGHTADSASFSVTAEDGRAVLTGDTILGFGTTVVAYPDGDLAHYLDSLRRLRACGPVPVLPGHGPALTDCAAAAGFALGHRMARLNEVRAVLADGVTDPGEAVAIIYRDVDEALWPAAELSVRAAMAYLADPVVDADPAAEADVGSPPAGPTLSGDQP
jgi:glyoxylase-like metal-dependent hydrolase (beta-lactamase superfamily II)